MVRPSSGSIMATENQDSTPASQSGKAQSPIESRSSTEHPKPPNTSLDHGSKEGADEAEEEEGLGNLGNDDLDPSRTSSSASLRLRDFGLRPQGPEDDAWLLPANRPIFSVNPASASQSAPSPQPTVAATAAPTDPPQQDPVAVLPRLLPAPDIRPSLSASSRRANRAQPPGPLSRIPSLPPRRRTASRRSGTQDQDTEPKTPPVQPTPAEPPARASPDPSRAREPLSRRLSPSPPFSHFPSIWPSQEVVYGKSTARQSFLGSSFQSFSGGDIFAALQQQGTIVQSDSAWHKEAAAAEEEARARQRPRKTGENKNKSSRSEKKARTDRKRPGETVWQLEQPSKKARADDDDGQQASETDHDGEGSGDQGRSTGENQIAADQGEPQVMQKTSDAQEERSDEKEGNVLEQQADKTSENADIDEHSNELQDVGASEVSSADNSNVNAIIGDEVESPEATVTPKAGSEGSVHAGAILQGSGAKGDTKGENTGEVKSQVNGEAKDDVRSEAKVKDEVEETNKKGLPTNAASAEP